MIKCFYSHTKIGKMMAMKCKELRKLKLNWLNPGAKLLHENAFRKAIRVLSRSCSIFNEIKSSRAISNWCEVLRARAAQICKFNSNFGTARLPFRSTPDRKLIIWCSCTNEMEKNIKKYLLYFFLFWVAVKFSVVVRHLVKRVGKCQTW